MPQTSPTPRALPCSAVPSVSLESESSSDAESFHCYKDRRIIMIDYNQAQEYGILGMALVSYVFTEKGAAPISFPDNNNNNDRRAKQFSGHRCLVHHSHRRRPQ